MKEKLKLLDKYNLERINYLKQNKSKITEKILGELRSFGIPGKQIALDILELNKDDTIQDIHCIEIQKCREDLFYFKDNYLLVLNKDELQDKMLKAIITNKKVQLTSDRQTKKSYAAVIYALHQFNFEANKIIGIAAAKTLWSKQLISDITNLYNQLPEWMRTPARNLKTSMTSEACVQIIIDKADEFAFRGISLDTLIIENAGTIVPNKFKECLDSILPTMIISKEPKIIVIDKNILTPSEFIEVNESTILTNLETSTRTKKLVLKRTFKQIIKDFIVSLYKRIKG